MVAESIAVTSRNNEKCPKESNQVGAINMWDPNNRITETILAQNIALRTSLANKKRKSKFLLYELQRSLAKNNKFELEKKELCEEYATRLMALKEKVGNCIDIATRRKCRKPRAQTLENYHWVIENTFLTAEKLSLQKQVESLNEKLRKLKSERNGKKESPKERGKKEEMDVD